MSPRYTFKASEKIGEKITKEALKQLQVWCNEERLPLNDEQLALFLWGSQNQVATAQNIIEKYLRCRIKSPDLFYNLDPEGIDMKQATTVFDIAVMPTRTGNNEIVFFARLNDTSYHNFHLVQLAKLIFLIVDLSLRIGPADGFLTVIDMKGAGLLHLTRLRVGVVQKFFQYIQEGLPCPIKKVHVLNTVPFIDKVLFIIKPFLKKELYDAIIFHPSGANMDEILDFPKECLPGDYSGTLPDAAVLAQNTYTEMRKMTSFYNDLEHQVRTYDKLKTNI